MTEHEFRDPIPLNDLSRGWIATSPEVRAAIEAECGVQAQLSTTGGTSDGRFIATICPQVIELGPRNHSIHKIDECVEAADIDRLSNIYRRVMEDLLL